METHRRGAAARVPAVAVALALIGLPTAAVAEGALVTTPLRGLDARSTALLESKYEGGHFEVRLLAVGSRPAGASARGGLDLVLEVGAGGLAPAAGQAAVPLVFHAYALDEADGVAGILSQSVEIEASALATPWRAGLKLVARLEIPPGEYRVRALVMRTDDRSFGLVEETARVPAGGEAAPALVALEPAERWIVARAPGSAAAGPFAGEQHLPAALPAIRGTSAGGLLLALREATPAGGWRVRLAGRSGRELELVADATELSGSPTESWRAFRVRGGGGGVRPGEYLLQLEAPKGRAPAHQVALTVGEDVETAKPPGAPLWPDFVSEGEAKHGDGPAVDLAFLREIARAIAPAELEIAYLEALALLGAGDEAAAVERLAEAEPAVLSGDAAERYERLLDVQLQIAADLAEIDRESLVPVVRLHELAYSTYLQRGQAPLATRTRRIATRLALAYAQREKSDAARRIAARALESLGVRVLEGGGRLEAARLFLDAIELDPGARGSLRAVALLLEFGGQYQEARGFLERAAKIDPRDPALRLRLAVQRKRTGDLAGAERDLRAGLEDGPEWTRTVAAEELARLLAARGAHDEAIAILAAVLERRDEPGVRIQLASLLDQAGRRGEAAAQLAELEKADHADVDSPRRTYDQLRDLPELDEAALAFEAAARARYSNLAAAHRALAAKMGRR